MHERHGGGLLVATIRDDQYADRRGSARKISKGVRLFLDRADRGFFFLDHAITADEAELAARLYPGQDFTDRQLGIGLKLVAGRELIARLGGSERSSPQGWAVVKAAVDYIWMGLRAEGDHERADTLLARAFELGDVQGAAELAAFTHEKGDVADALRWAAAAAERGHAFAAYLAGRLSYQAGQHEDAEKWFRIAADAGIGEAAVRLAALVARHGDLRAAELILTGPVSQGEGLALYAVGDLAWRRGWMSAAESYFAAAVDAGHLFAALDAAALADARGAAELKTHWLEQWKSGRTMSSMALAYEKDYHRIGLTIIRNAPWEPGQPATYRISTSVTQVWINSESGLDLPLE
jgi:TPR repeat protein